MPGRIGRALQIGRAFTMDRRDNVFCILTPPAVAEFALDTLDGLIKSLDALDLSR